MDPRPHRMLFVVLACLHAIPTFAQELDWVATFDDVAAGRESPRSSVLSSTGELHILSDHSDGYVYFRVASDGQARETRFAVPASQGLFGPAADQSGGAYLAQVRYIVGSDRVRLAILHLGMNDEQWIEGGYEEPGDRGIRCHALQTDAAGNAIVSGVSTFSPDDFRMLTVCFGPDAQLRWVARYDAARLVNAETYPGGVRATADSDGSIYVAAQVNGGDGNTDTLLVKYDSQGQEIWARRFDVDAESGQGFSPATLIIDGNGEIFVCGPSQTPRGFASARFDALGNLLGRTLTPHPGFVNGATARVNPVDGGVLVGTSLQINTMFYGHWDFGLFRYGPAGELIYFSNFGVAERSDEMLKGLAVDAEGRAYLGGDTDAGGAQDLWMIQVLPDGTRGWATRYSTSGGVFGDRAAGFLRDALGRLTIVASTLDAHDGTDTVAVQLSDAGVVESDQIFNTTVRSREWGMHGVVVSESGSIYICGNSQQYPDFGSMVTVKYDLNGVEQWRRRVTDLGGSGFKLGLRGGQLPVVLGWVGPDDLYEARNVLLIEYVPDGSESWRLEYDGPLGNGDSPLDMVIDRGGNTYVTIQSGDDDHYVTVLLKVDGFGRILWERFADGFGSGPLAIDDAGNAYLSGPGTTLAKFDSDGDLQWIRWREPSADCDEHIQASVANPNGSVILAGETCTDGPPGVLAVVRCGPDGEIDWHFEDTAAYGRSTATHLIVDAGGEIFVAGVGSRTAVGRLSRQGQLRWMARSEPDFSTSSVGLGLDGIGHVYHAGSWRPQNDDADYLLTRYDLDGNLDWRARFGLIDGGDDVAGGLVIDSAGYGSAYLVGQSNGGTTHGDFVTLQYGPAPIPCAGGTACRSGDANRDCRVDLEDLGLVLANFGLTHGTSISPRDGDLNFDGTTDLQDLADLLSAFGADCR